MTIMGVALRQYAYSGFNGIKRGNYFGYAKSTDDDLEYEKLTQLWRGKLLKRDRGLACSLIINDKFSAIMTTFITVMKIQSLISIKETQMLWSGFITKKNPLIFSRKHLFMTLLQDTFHCVPTLK